MRFVVIIALAVTFLKTTAYAAPIYTTSVTVPYDATAPSFCNPNCVSTSASNNSQYTVQTGEDATFFYADIKSTPNTATDQTLQFANIYLGGTHFTNNLIIEVTNDRASTTDNPSGYVSLDGTGYTFSKSLNDISFIIPFAYLENNPSQLNYGSVAPGDLLRISYSQSFGYSLVYGGSAPYNPVTRLGSQIVPAAIPTGVPEPASLALLGVGVAGLLAARRHRAV